MNLTSTTRIAVILAVIALIALPLAAQNGTPSYNGGAVASNFAYGTGNIPPLRVVGGPYASGAVTIKLDYGQVSTPDGMSFAPLNANAPITIGSGTTIETVTLTSVSCATPAIYGSCSMTGTFTYAHGNGEAVVSGTAGLQEAINWMKDAGGGYVTVERMWSAKGGTTAMINAAKAYSNVVLVDSRSGMQYWSMQPTTLTSLAAPATLNSTSATWTSGGTWTAAPHYLCVTYVDALGGEGPCSATYNVTPSASSVLHIASPAASTGAVGWRAYAGATYNGAYLLPITSARCTQTTLETVMPACAIGAAGTWPAIFLTTTTLRPNAQTPTVNLNLPWPQGHTTFAYRPSGAVPLPFQAHYGPFPAMGDLSAGQIAILGSVNLPTGYLNQIGRTVRITGKITAGATTNTAAVPVISVLLGWVGGTTAGAPVATCVNTTPAALGSTAAWNFFFSCTLTTNATGDAAATVMASGTMSYALAAGTAAATVAPDALAAAVGSLGLSQQNTIFVKYTSGTDATNTPQLIDLHVETLL